MPRKRCEIGDNVVLFTRKLHTGFRSLPKSVTMSNTERHNGRHYALFHTKPAFGANCVKFTEV